MVFDVKLTVHWSWRLITESYVIYILILIIQDIGTSWNDFSFILRILDSWKNVASEKVRVHGYYRFPIDWRRLPSFPANSPFFSVAFSNGMGFSSRNCARAINSNRRFFHKCYLVKKIFNVYGEWCRSEFLVSHGYHFVNYSFEFLIWLWQVWVKSLLKIVTYHKCARFLIQPGFVRQNFSRFFSILL